MAKKAPCKCKPSECEECPEWIFTFADLVMLMMGFFVILWVLKPSPNPKTDPSANDDWIKLAAAVRAEFGYVPKSGTQDPVDNYMLDKMSQPKIPDGPGAGGKTKVRPEGAHGTDPEVTAIRPGHQAMVGGRLLFDRGDAHLVAGIPSMLDEIADKIRGHLTIVLIKGHTSLDDFEDSATPQQKLDLSIRRAQAVCDYLTDQGVDPEILRVVGCSTFEPVVQREYEPQSQAANRRVEVEASDVPVVRMQGSPTTQTTADAK